ncbi:MAG: DUF4831 family protein [Bacteroidetes bacterium]|nr:DUF4831 family protein [Bacteroidota bacterium]
METKRFFFRLILLLMLLGSSIAYAQINVVHIDNNTFPQTNEGIFYSLPRTVVNVTVKIDRIENYQGPYADYALRYLGLKNVVQSNTIEYKISDINISTSYEPDPDQYYFIELGEKISKGEKAGLLSLTDAGIILGTLPSEADTTTQANRLLNAEEPPLEREKDAFGELFRNYTDVSVFEKIDTIRRKINIDTMTLERQYLKKTMVEKSPEQKAKEAADFLSKIKDNRFNLITGFQEVNYNKETLEFMDAQLKNLEREYLKLFTGVKIHKTMTFSYKYIPTPNQINTEIPIFKFNKSKGVQDLDAQGGGKVITIRVQRVGNTNSVSVYLQKAGKAAKSSGFYYRIPEYARVTVKVDDNTQEEQQCLISQLGLVTNLPSGKWKVLFHPETGSIKSLSIE